MINSHCRFFISCELCYIGILNASCIKSQVYCRCECNSDRKQTNIFNTINKGAVSKGKIKVSYIAKIMNELKPVILGLMPAQSFAWQVARHLQKKPSTMHRKYFNHKLLQQFTYLLCTISIIYTEFIFALSQNFLIFQFLQNLTFAGFLMFVINQCFCLLH